MDKSIKPKGHGPSFLRWAGSKRQSLAILSQAYTDPKLRYVEPFAGSAALFFSLKPNSGILGDLNGHLINALRNVRDSPRELHQILIGMPRTPEAYYIARATFNQSKPFGIHSAALFIYLNRNCFNGLWRTNQAGVFNVPYGGSEMGGNPPLTLLEACSSALKRTKLRHQDFRKTLSEIGADSFVYADPPYFTSTERTFIEYGKKSFGQNDLRDLIAALSKAADRGARIALTYSEAMPIVDIPKEWKRLRFEVTRNVGGFSGSRKKHAEILYTNVPVEQESM